MTCRRSIAVGADPVCALRSGHLGDCEPRFLSAAPRRPALVEALYATNHAVMTATGHSPTSFLLGRLSYREFTVSRVGGRPQPPQDLHFLGMPVRLDPSRGYSVLAVPSLDWALDRGLPAGAHWFEEE